MEFSSVGRFLQYGSPVALFTLSVCSLSIQACSLQSKPKAQKGKVKSTPLEICIILLVIGIMLSYIFDAAEAVESLINSNREPDPSLIIYAFASCLFWATVSLHLDDIGPSWSYIAYSVCAFLFELVLLMIWQPASELSLPFRYALYADRVLRLMLLVSLILASIWRDRRSSLPAPSSETTPLLSSTNPGNAPEYGTANGNESGSSDGSDDEGDDEEEEDMYWKPSKYLQKKKRERLEQSGSWFAYISAYRVFLPYIIPARNLKIQLCFLFVTVSLVIQRFLNLLLPVLLGRITDRLAESANTHIVPMKEIGIWIALSYVDSSAFLSTMDNLALIPLRQFTYRELTLGAFNHLMSLSCAFHNDKDSAEVIQAVQQSESLNDLLETVGLDIVPGLIDLFIAYGYFCYLFDVYVSFVVIVASILYLVVDRKIMNWQNDSRRKYVESFRKMLTRLTQGISGWQITAYFNRFDYESRQMRTFIEQYQDAFISYTVVRSGVSRMVSSTIIQAARYAVIILVAIRIAQGKAPVGSFVTMYTYFGSLTSPIQNISRQYRWLSGSMIDSERLLILFQTKPTVVDKPAAPDLTIKTGEVQLKNIHFKYDQRKPILKDVSVTVPGGSTVAFVGETGAGKSTIFKLLFRLYDVDQGAIKIDGQDIRDVTLDSLRETMGVVPQDSTLFNLSIMENLKYANFDATDEMVHQACRDACIHDKIMTFPDKYESKVGERGIKLSGGEQQRLAIARIILKNPKIVLLDEATSAIDSDTEVKIQAAFRNLSRGRTTFVIAHRLSTIVHSDLIVVMHDGQVAETGTHEGLLKTKGKYYNLWQKQIAATLNSVKEDDASKEQAAQQINSEGSSGNTTEVEDLSSNG